MRLLFSEGVKLVLRRAQTRLFTGQNAAAYARSMVAYRSTRVIMIIRCGGSVVVQTYRVTVLS